MITIAWDAQDRLDSTSGNFESILTSLEDLALDGELSVEQAGAVHYHVEHLRMVWKDPGQLAEMLKLHKR